MADLTAPTVIEFVRHNELLTPAQAQELSKLQAQFPDVRALVGELVRRGWLTPYQANQLLQGHGADLVLGPYRLLQRLGEGGMGQVFTARHVRMDRVVALKVIHKENLGSAKAVQRFTQEARAAARLSHPNIVVAHDADAVGDRHFLAMEHVEGTDLAKLVKQSGPLPVAQACEFARQAALGLQHAHERGVVHRDIKPSNLMLAHGAPPATPVVKILDFGVARFESEAAPGTRLTRLGTMVGTVDFISPEQADNARKADIRADIYSLGCSLFYLLTGKVPFPGEDAVTKVVARLVDKPPSPRAIRPDMPQALESVLAKMMARDPGQRYQTPAEAAAALEPFARVERSGLTPSRQPPPKANETPAGIATAATVLAGPADKVPAVDRAPVARAQPLMKMAPRTRPAGARRHWPLFAAAAGIVFVAVLVGVLLRLQSGSAGSANKPPETAPTPGPVVQGKADANTSKGTSALDVVKDKAGGETGKDTKQAKPAGEDAQPKGEPKPEPQAETKPIIVRKGQKLVTNSIGMKLALIPAGKFMMGSPETEAHRSPAEHLHPVKISQPFYMGICGVTQGQYQRLTGHNPSFFQRGNDKVGAIDTSEFPVDQVSWQDALAFCKQLSDLPAEKAAGLVYRLPTEAEREYACRAGTTTPFAFGQALTAEQANIENKLDRTTKVGSYRPNAFGLYDMHGNLNEWCADWSKHSYYVESPTDDPQGPPDSTHRAARGGAWNNEAKECRSASRGGGIPQARLNYIGFRVVCGVPRESPKGQEPKLEVKNTEPAKEKATEAEVKKPEPAKIKEKVPAGAAALVAALKGKDKAERVKAAEKLGSLGEKAGGVLRALCQAALDPDDEVKGAALDALEKLSPALHGPVLTLLVDRDRDKHLAAISTIARLKDGGAPAAPVLATYCAKQMPFNFDVKGIAFALFALHRIAPHDPLTLESALRLADWRQKDGRPNDRVPLSPQTRYLGMAVAANLAMRDPAMREKVVPILLSVLEEAAKGRLPFAAPQDDVLFLAVWGLVAFGDDGKVALPLLKKLKLHENARCRVTAAAALRQMVGEAGPGLYTVELEPRAQDVRYYYFKEGDRVEVQVTGEGGRSGSFEARTVVDPTVGGLSAAKGSGSFVVPRTGFHRIAVMEAAGQGGRFQVTITVK
jgi:serine/threonine protein kinase/formylglycine-generating enzyme required for sulfatase activity